MTADDRPPRGSLPMTQQGSMQSPESPVRSDRSPWNWLLLLPLLVTLYPPLYNRDTPELAGIPFFYWYQLAVIAIGVLSTYVVYRQTRR